MVGVGGAHEGRDDEFWGEYENKEGRATDEAGEEESFAEVRAVSFGGGAYSHVGEEYAGDRGGEKEHYAPDHCDARVEAGVFGGKHVFCKDDIGHGQEGNEAGTAEDDEAKVYFLLEFGGESEAAKCGEGEELFGVVLDIKETD